MTPLVHSDLRAWDKVRREEWLQMLLRVASVLCLHNGARLWNTPPGFLSL